MKIGRVIGTVVATRKSAKLTGTKLLIVEEHDVRGKPRGNFVVAADTVQAGAGDTVLYVSGSSARMAYPQEGTPIDAAISAVIDSIEYDGKVVHPNALAPGDK